MNRERAIELSAYANEARERGWRLSPIEIKNIGDGAERYLLDQYPNCTAADVAPIAKLLRDRACGVRSQLGRWPPGKSYFASELEALILTHNEVFTLALAKN